MITRSILFGLLAGCLRQCAAQVSSNTDYFQTPPAASGTEVLTADLVWTLGSSQTLIWATSIDVAYNIDLVTDITGDTIGQIYRSNSGETGAQSYTWTVTSLGATVPGVFCFYLSNANNFTEGFTSHWFNITEAATSSTTTSTSSTTSSNPTSTFLTSTIPTPTSSLSATNSPSSGSSDSLAIGLGVGLGLGIPLIIAAVVWMLWRKKSQRRIPLENANSYATEKTSFMGAPEEAPGDLPPGNSYKDVHEAPSGGFAAAELPTQRLDPVELDAQERGK